MLILVLSVGLPLFGQERDRPYPTVGIPTEPKVSAHWNRYHDYAEATELLHALADAHPDRCRLISLGRSHGGREMWVLIVTDFNTGDPDRKSVFWIDGGIHANEIQATEAVLYTAWFLAEMDGENERVSRMLDRRTFYLMPMMSPDSRDAHMHEPNTTHSPRSGQIPVDDDRDGRIDEDGFDDLDGNGHITQMRIRDPNGEYRPHDEFPRMMVRAEQGEEGAYRMLGWEGYDNDGDGRVNEDGDGFYDPNRNWPWRWQPEYVQRGADRYPLSIPANRMVADFIVDHPNIAGAQSYHNAGGMILRGPAAADAEYEPADVAVFDAIAEKGEMMLPGYRYIETKTDLYPGYGMELDWFYGMRGVVTFTNEMFPGFNLFREENEDAWFGTREEQHRFNEYLLLGDGFVDWHEVEHPEYGTIEVGGFKKSWVRQPPSFLLQEESHRNMAFTLYHAEQMPLVGVQSVEARPLGGGLTEVTAVVENRRLTPTRLAVDVKRNIGVPDIVAIHGEGVEVIAGLRSDGPFFEDPTEQERNPRELRFDRIPGHGAVYARWLVRGDGPFTVTVRSMKGGRDRMTN